MMENSAEKRLTFDVPCDEFIENYIEQHKTGSAWNETQLKVMVEMLVYFIDSYAEIFIEAGFPGDVIWVFEQLDAINQYVHTHNARYDDAHLLQLKSPLTDFRITLTDLQKEHPFLPYTTISSITKPLQLIGQSYYELGLEKLQRTTYYFSKTQKEQAHDMIKELLQKAIYNIKKTKSYQEALGAGKLYNPTTAYLTTKTTSSPKKEAKVKPEGALSSPSSSAKDIRSAPTLPALQVAGPAVEEQNQQEESRNEPQHSWKVGSKASIESRSSASLSMLFAQKAVISDSVSEDGDQFSIAPAVKSKKT